MANVTSPYVDVTISNVSNQSVGGDALFTATASRSDSLHPLYKMLFVIRMSVGSAIAGVMLVSNVLTLCAVWITPRLRVSFNRKLRRDPDGTQRQNVAAASGSRRAFVSKSTR